MKTRSLFLTLFFTACGHGTTWAPRALDTKPETGSDDSVLVSPEDAPGPAKTPATPELAAGPSASEVERRTVELAKRGRHAEAFELAAAACETDPGAGCRLFGDALDAGLGGAGQEAAATRAYRTSCRAGDPRGCGRYAERLEKGVGTRKDEAGARKLYLAACEAEDFHACSGAALMLRFGRGGPKDAAAGNALSLRACVNGVAQSCANLGHAYRTGDGVPRDDERAAQLYADACRQDSAGGCANLAYLFSAGLGVTEDADRARALRTRACELGRKESCVDVAVADHAAGRTRAALRRLRRLCLDGGLARACDEARVRTSDPRRAEVLMRQSCDLGSAGGCVAWGRRQADTKTGRPAATFARACDLDPAKGCRWSAWWALKRGHRRVARAPAERGCAAGDGWACERLGQVHLAAEPPATAAARRAFERGCELEDVESCLALTHHAELELGPDEARRVSRRACDLDPKRGCLRHALLLSSGSADDVRHALRLYEQLCRDHGLSVGCNGAAWTLATTRHLGLREPDTALTLARQAIELAEAPLERALYHDTLAAAYAADGRYRSAALTQEKALRQVRSCLKTQDDPLARGELPAMVERYELYRRGRPFVDDATPL